MISEAAELAVRMALRERYESDQTAGSSRSLAEYQSAFPGFEALVAEEIGRIESGVAPPPRPPAQGPPAAIGPYTIDRELGRGGQGAVYLATDSRLGRRVALKTLPMAWATSPAGLARLAQEARVLASLDHPGICQIWEAAHEGGLPYFAMRYVEGSTLAALLATRTGSPDGAAVAAAVTIVEKTARAAHAAHEAGVVHRDLKPANVMIASDEQPVILDFGLARAAGDDVLDLTASGDVLGTPHYMSPEQAAGDVSAIDRRSDVHALGVMLFEAVTGARPYSGVSRETLLGAVRSSPPPDARKLNPRVSADLRTVIETALAKASADRYQTALDLAEDLRRVRLFEPIRARPIPWIGRLLRFARRRPAIAALALVLVVAVPAIGGFAGWYFANRPLVDKQIETEQLADLERQLELGFNGMDSAGKLAIRAFSAATRIRPDSTEAAAGSAIALLRANNPKAALEHLDAFRSRHGARPVIERLRTDCMRRLGKNEEATALAASLPPVSDHVECFVEGLREMLAAQSGARGGYDRAVEWLFAAKERAPHLRRMYHRMFCQAVGLSSYDTLSRWAAASATVIVTGWAGHAAAGHALVRVDPKAAVDAFERAAKMNPEYTYEYGVMMTFERQGRIEEAARVARNLTKRVPDDATAFLNVALLEGARNDYPAALAAARRAVELRPDLADMHVALAHVLKKTGDRVGTKAEIGRALQVEPQNPSAHHEMAECLIGENDLDGAEAHARSGIETDPKMAELKWVLAKILVLRSRVEEGFVAFRDSGAEPTQTLRTIVEYAKFYAEHGEPVRASTFLELANRLAGPAGLPDAIAREAMAVRDKLESEPPASPPQ